MRATPAASRGGGKSSKYAIVAVEDRGAAGLEPCEDLRLGLGDRRDAIRRYSRCTGSTVVTIATCGRTSLVSGVISPAWFMPISKTPKRRSPACARASAARPSGC